MFFLSSAHMMAQFSQQILSASKSWDTDLSLYLGQRYLCAGTSEEQCAKGHISPLDNDRADEMLGFSRPDMVGELSLLETFMRKL